MGPQKILPLLSECSDSSVLGEGCAGTACNSTQELGSIVRFRKSADCIIAMNVAQPDQKRELGDGRFGTLACFLEIIS